jgi:hypothetical protein
MYKDCQKLTEALNKVPFQKKELDLSLVRFEPSQGIDARKGIEVVIEEARRFTIDIVETLPDGLKISKYQHEAAKKFIALSLGFKLLIRDRWPNGSSISLSLGVLENGRVIGIDLNGERFKNDGVEIAYSQEALRSLSRFFTASSCSINDYPLKELSFFSELSELTHIDIYRNDIEDFDTFFDNLAGMKKLKFLRMIQSYPKDISGLKKLDLEKLYFDARDVTDFSPLLSQKHLKNLGFNSGGDISIVRDMPSVENVDVCFNKDIVDLSPLLEMQNLKRFDLSIELETRTKINKEVIAKLRRRGVEIMYD